MTLLESGAKSLASHYGLDWDDLPQDPQHQGVHDFHCKAFWLGMSRAYLEGIREPTPTMIAAWGTTEPKEWQADDDAYAVTGWQDMIDAALAEKTD